MSKPEIKPEALIELVLGGRHEEALAALDEATDDTSLAEEAVRSGVASALEREAADWMRAHDVVSGASRPHSLVWPDAQAGAVALGRRCRYDLRPTIRLASALLSASSWAIDFNGDEDVSDEAFQFILEFAGPELRFMLDREDMVPSGVRVNRSIYNRLIKLEGDAGREWLLFLLARNSNFGYALSQAIYGDEEPRWSPTKWIEALETIAAAKLTPTPELFRNGAFVLFHGSPDEALPYAFEIELQYEQNEASLAHFVEVAARKRVSGDDAADAAIFFWPTDKATAERAAWLIEATVGSDRFDDVVEAAVAGGHLEAHAAVLYSKAEESPSERIGADWVYLDRVPLGNVNVTSGEISACDLSVWYDEKEEEPAWTVAAAAGEYQVEMLRASQAISGTALAGTVLWLDLEGTPTEWEQLVYMYEDEFDEAAGGYMLENSMWGICDRKALTGPFVDARNDSIEKYFGLPGDGKGMDAEVIEIDGFKALLAPGPQHHCAKSWIGRAEDGHPVVIVTELGTLDFDPVRDGKPPWD